MIQRAYETAVARLRQDPHFPLPVPTLIEVAASYRRIVPDARMREIRAQLAEAGLALADDDPRDAVSPLRALIHAPA